MLTNILPVVHGHGQQGGLRWKWLGLAALHTFGTALAAGATGGILAAAAWTLGRSGFDPSYPASWTSVLIALVYLPGQLGWVGWPPLLQSTRQVPRRWAADYPSWTTALLFGFGLGSGIYTRIITPAFYLLLLWPFVAQSPLLSVAVWMGYGVARSLNVWWLASTAPIGDPFSRASHLTGLLLKRTAWMSRSNAVVLFLVAWSLIARRYFG